MKRQEIPNRVGPYSVERFVGQGGCATVVLGKNDAGRSLALKIIPGLALQGQRDSRRFRREIKVLAEFSHPNLVRILDAGFDGEWFYYGMEYLDGGTLQDRMGEGRVSLPRVLGWMIGLSRALGFLHERGIIHRDLKPTNILLSASGVPKVSDLGLAHISELTSITSRGVLVGTLRYMSPEMFRSEAITPASDIYQLGLLFYELLTGTPAHPTMAATNMISTILDHHPVSASTLVPDLPGDVAVLVDLCLSKDPRVRPQNGEELARLLAEIPGERAPSGNAPRVTEVSAPTPKAESMSDSLGAPGEIMGDEVAGLVLSQKKVLERLRLLCAEGPYVLWRIAAHRTLETLGFSHYILQLKLKPDHEGPSPEHREVEFTVVVARDPQGRLRVVHLAPAVARA